jgi:hypothetical protein
LDSGRGEATQTDHHDEIDMIRTDMLPPREAQDRHHKVFSRPWRITTLPPRNARVESPRKIAQRQHRIRIERAVFLIARVGCSTRAACRNVGLPVSCLSDQNEVRRLCDARNIPRRHQWGMPYFKTIEGDYPVYVKPRAK